jgi:hypothetical protein
MAPETLSQTADPVPETDPAAAFEEVRRELSMLESAIKGLTAARENAPDYSLTLGDMGQSLAAIEGRLHRIEKSKALALSPVELAKEINTAAEAVRSHDRQTLAEASDALNRSLGWINGMIHRGQAVDRRSEREWLIGAGGVIVGILLWSILPGAVIRSLPASWHAPEWMAARMMGVERAAAGPKVIEAAKAGSRSAPHAGH